MIPVPPAPNGFFTQSASFFILREQNEEMREKETRRTMTICVCLAFFLQVLSSFRMRWAGCERFSPPCLSYSSESTPASIRIVRTLTQLIDWQIYLQSFRTCSISAILHHAWI
jgi:hypothetical protein